MVEVKIGLDGTVTPNKIVLGNMWENNDEKIYFTMPEDFAEYNKYLIGVMKQSVGNQTVVLPITDNTCYVSSSLTHLSGNWNLYVMCRELSIDLKDETIDIGAQDNERVFISNVFTGTVNKNMIAQDSIENVALDTNLQILYDELYVLKKEILDKLNEDDSKLTGSYNDLEDKPSINGQELSGDKTLYDFNYVPIHKVEVKSVPALYKALKNIGLTLDEDDVSNFLFLLNSNEVETTFDGKFVELEIMKIYTAEYSPITNVAIIKCPDFTMTINQTEIIDYVEQNRESEDIDPALLDSKLDVYQGEENAGKILQVGEDGNTTLVDASNIAAVDSEELDLMLEEVFTNG